MSQIERGGQNVQGWPAEPPDTDSPEELAERSDRLAALPAHERDPGDGRPTDDAADGDGDEGGIATGYPMADAPDVSER